MKQPVGVNLEYRWKWGSGGPDSTTANTWGSLLVRHWSKYSIYMISVNPHVTDEQTKVQSNLPKLLACDRSRRDWNSSRLILGSVLTAIILCCLSQGSFRLQRDNTWIQDGRGKAEGRALRNIYIWGEKSIRGIRWRRQRRRHRKVTGKWGHCRGQRRGKFQEGRSVWSCRCVATEGLRRGRLICWRLSLLTFQMARLVSGGQGKPEGQG